MKRSIFVLLGMGILTVTAPANAVQKCVALDASSTTCTSTPAGGNADWSATCTTNGTSVPIKGIAMCSNQAGAAQYATSDAITTVSSASDTTNVNCWCKMVEPAVSSWVFFNANSSAGNCAGDCSFYCALYARSYSAFRSALFSSLGD
ncbi:MAG: hypothetical protein IJX89_05310 [Alphaproteobacteria bacterium]|nr:hypothetical protein [Alphaproteobacteria bacterium]